MTSDIVIDTLHVSRTYGGWAMGAPRHPAAIAAAKKLAVQLFGERPTVILEPPLKPVMSHQPERNHYMLPRWQYLAWFTGPVLGKDPFNDGSQLVVIWWADECTYDFSEVLAKIDWAANAKDFGF